MNKSYSKNLDRVYLHAHSTDLADRISAKIIHSAAVQAQRRAYGFGAISLLALIALIPAIQSALSAAAQSGFYEYISLFVSDSGYVFNNAKEVLFSIAESMPIFSFAAIISALLITALTAQKSSSYIRTSRALAISLSF